MKVRAKQREARMLRITKLGEFPAVPRIQVWPKTLSPCASEDHFEQPRLCVPIERRAALNNEGAHADI